VRGGHGLEVSECGAGAGKISQISAGADKKFQPAQDSRIYPLYTVLSHPK